MKTKTTIALLLLAASAHAQSADARDEKSILRALANASSTLKDKVAVVLGQQQAAIDKRCPLGDLKPDLITVLNDPAFNLNGIPERGDWMVHYATKACKTETTRTAVFHGGPKGVAIEAAAPGATLADASLGKDVWTAFQRAAKRAKPDCDDMTLIDTAIAEAPVSSATYWREAWIGRVCGAQMGQIVSFYPSAKGTMFRMALPEDAPGAAKRVAPTYSPPGQ